MQAIADRLTTDGVPTPTATRGEARGLVTGPGKWHAATVAKLCRNPRAVTNNNAKALVVVAATLDNVPYVNQSREGLHQRRFWDAGEHAFM